MESLPALDPQAQGAPGAAIGLDVAGVARIRGRGDSARGGARGLDRARRERARLRDRGGGESDHRLALYGLADALEHLGASRATARGRELLPAGPYVAFEAIRTLALEHHAETTFLGIGLSAGTLCICPWLGRAKLRLGEELDSSATAGEGRQNLICAYLALAVLAGLLANTLFGIWWLDPTVALNISGLAVWEGRRSWRGESCECAGCAIPGPR